MMKHEENSIPEPIDDGMTPWQSMKANPKVVLWTLYTNRMSGPII